MEMAGGEAWRYDCLMRKLVLLRIRIIKEKGGLEAISFMFVSSFQDRCFVFVLLGFSSWCLCEMREQTNTNSVVLVRYGEVECDTTALGQLDLPWSQGPIVSTPRDATSAGPS